MSHKLLALVLAAVIGAAPVAREMCELSCVEHHSGSTTSAEAQHDHHHNTAGTADTSSTASASVGVQGCSHEVESQPVSFTAKVEVAAPAVAVHRVDPAEALASTVSFSTLVRGVGLTPVPIALRTPLRV